MILRALAIANLRWAAADMARSNRLAAEAADAMDAASARMEIAQAHADRLTALRT